MQPRYKPPGHPPASVRLTGDVGVAVAAHEPDLALCVHLCNLWMNPFARTSRNDESNPVKNTQLNAEPRWHAGNAVPAPRHARRANIKNDQWKPNVSTSRTLPLATAVRERILAPAAVAYCASLRRFVAHSKPHSLSVAARINTAQEQWHTSALGLKQAAQPAEKRSLILARSGAEVGQHAPGQARERQRLHPDGARPAERGQK